MAFAALQNGSIIAGYRIDGTLGEGGMGTVYRATQLSLDRVVAFKVVAASLSDDLSFRDRFRREGQLQAALDHPAHRARVRGRRGRLAAVPGHAPDRGHDAQGADHQRPAR